MESGSNLENFSPTPDVSDDFTLIVYTDALESKESRIEIHLSKELLEDFMSEPLQNKSM